MVSGLFHLTCNWSADKGRGAGGLQELLCQTCLILCSTSACAAYQHHISHTNRHSGPVCAALPRSQSTLLCCFYTTALGKSHSADRRDVEREGERAKHQSENCPLFDQLSFSGPDRSAAQLARVMVHLAQFVILFPISISPLAFSLK